MHRTSARLGAARWALAPDTGSLPWPRLRPTQPHVDWTACFLGCSEPWAPAFTSSSTPSVLSGVIPTSRLMLFIYPSVRLSSMGISCLSTYRPLLSPTYLPPHPPTYHLQPIIRLSTYLLSPTLHPLLGVLFYFSSPFYKKSPGMICHYFSLTSTANKLLSPPCPATTLAKIVDDFHVVSPMARCQCCSYSAHRELFKNVHVQPSALGCVHGCPLSWCRFPWNLNVEYLCGTFRKLKKMCSGEAAAVCDRGDRQTAAAAQPGPPPPG